MISQKLPFQESIEHKIFRDQQKNSKSGYVNYDSFARLYYEYRQIYYDYLLNLVINLIEYKNIPKTLHRTIEQGTIMQNPTTMTYLATLESPERPQHDA